MGGLGRLLIVAVLLLAGCVNAPGAGPSAQPSASRPIQAVIAVGARPGVPVAGAGAVWVPNTGDGTVSRIDPRSNRVVATLRIGDQLAYYKRDCELKGSVHSFMGTSVHVRDCDLPSALAVSGNALWVLKNDEQMVLKLDPTSQRVLARVPLGFTPYEIAATDTALWITGYWVDQLVRVDPERNLVVARLTMPDGPAGIAASDQVVWVTNTIAGELSRIDPATNRVVARIALDCPAACYQGSLPLAVTTAPDTVWVRTVGDGLVIRVDPHANRVVTNVDVIYSLGRAGLDHLALFDGMLWVSGISLQRIDPETNRVSGTLDIDATTATTGFGSLWITDLRGRVERINPRA